VSAPPTVTPDPPRRRRGRPSRFSPADAVAAALDIGVSTFTMSAVAQRLEVTTPALYRCFPSREALLEASLSAVFADVTLPPDDADWRVFLERVTEGSWRLLTRYPGLSAVTAEREDLPAAAVHLRDEVYTTLGGHGFSRRQTRFAMVCIEQLTTSAADLLHHQLEALTRAADPTEAHLVRASDNRTITDADELTDCAHSQWQQKISFFLDHLDNLSPDWPEWIGPAVDPRQH
jgi:AcrR family transcriptional regulator